MDEAALPGAHGFAQDRADLGFTELSLDLIEVGELAEDPADELRGLVLGFENILLTWAWQPMRVAWSLPLARRNRRRSRRFG